MKLESQEKLSEEASDDTPCGKVQEILALYFWSAGDRRRVGIAGLFGANKRIKTGLRSRDEPQIVLLGGVHRNPRACNDTTLVLEEHLV